MSISLVGIEPGVPRRYMWIGDGAIDRERSNVSGWLSEGSGLVEREGEKATVFVCDALRPTTLAIVRGFAAMGAAGPASPAAVEAGELAMRNMPAVARAAVAYSVVAIENGPACERVHDAGGLRLSDALLDRLDRLTFVAKHGERAFTVRLMEHLGYLVLADAAERGAEGEA